MRRFELKVLLCDDEENIRSLMKRFFSLEAIDCDTAENGLSAQRMLRESAYDAVLVDLRMPGLDGLSLIKWLRAEGFRMPIIMISAHGEITDAVTALKEGADDYVVKPFDPEELVIKLKNLVEASNLKNLVEGGKRLDMLIGDSPEMLRIKSVIAKAALSSATVLITGESGTGKEVVAREIHNLSNVKDGPFIPINIGGIPENLLESELFGYEKGAFTGASSRKNGMFELASGGTLFLDEIGDMPLSLQVKILRVLQERKMTRLGGVEQIPINARIVAATNKNLEEMVKKGDFREDLFYRLNVVRIEIPPLRERSDDIPLLAAYIIRKLSRDMSSRITGFTPEAIEALKSHHFYGNVRELENIIERAMIFTDSSTIDVKDLDLRSSVSRSMKKNEELSSSRDARSLRDLEKDAIIAALHRWEGNRTKASEELGITRRTLISKIKEYDIKL